MKHNLARIFLMGFLALINPTLGNAASSSIGSSGSIAPALSFSNPVNLDFGELTIATEGVAGSWTIPANGAAGSGVNAIQVGVPLRGSIDLTGRKAVAVNFTITPGVFGCTTVCVGTPTFGAATSTFGGSIVGVGCPGNRCTDTVFIGGTFSFAAGNEEGTWASLVAVTANYQ